MASKKINSKSTSASKSRSTSVSASASKFVFASALKSVFVFGFTFASAKTNGSKFSRVSSEFAIAFGLSPKCAKSLKEYKDVFSRSYKAMPGLDPKVAVHHLVVKIGTRPIKQAQRHFRTGLVPDENAMVVEVQPPWRMYFDRASHHEGASAGVILVFSREDLAIFLTLAQCSSNNIAEYQALIPRL